MPITLPFLPFLFLSAGAFQPAPGTQLRATEPRAAAPIRIRQRIIIRVARISSPRMPISAAAPLPPISWVEQRGEQCLPMHALAGAAITRPDSVDLVLAGGRRMRAKLSADCPALGFYQGFTVAPTSDGRLCAQRDTIRARSGGSCRIEGFRALVPTR